TLFTENETNFERLYGVPSASRYVKDGIDRCIVQGDASAVNPRQAGTKAAVHYRRTLFPGETWTVRLRLSNQPPNGDCLGSGFDQVFDERKKEADEFYDQVISSGVSEDERRVQRQAFAGMLWSKQYYHYVIREWLDGDPASPAPPAERKAGRNRAWE